MTQRPTVLCIISSMVFAVGPWLLLEQCSQTPGLNERPNLGPPSIIGNTV